MKKILTEIILNKELDGLYQFHITLKEKEDQVNGSVEEGVFYSDIENPLTIGHEYNYIRAGIELVLDGFLPKQELIKKIDKKKPVDIKIIEELRIQTFFLDRVSYRIGWFYYLSIISLITSLVVTVYTFFILT
tara:strand:- start:17 stop:415 length:399 start_codon:yes stop_codon:yes gene_type:complete